MILTVALLVLGLVLLVVGGELLVRGGSGLGRAVGLSPLVIGLTVVAFATSAPELAVSVDAAVSGAPGIAVGNVVGSNISNILLVLGLAALVLPIAVRSQLVRVDVPVMVVFSVLALVAAWDGAVSRPEGVVLLAALVAYVVMSLRIARRPGEQAPVDDAAAAPATDDDAPPRPRPLRDVGLVLAGVALLVLGARLLVGSATTIAQAVGLSDLVIGLTVVAIGTSLPEVATSVIAAVRGEREMAIGNVLGSNIFNIGAVLGLTALIAPDGVPVADAAIRFDLPVMVVVALVVLPVVFTGAQISRWEAVAFLAYYVAYIAYLLLAAADHDALPVLSTALVWFVAPMTALLLALLTAHEFRARRRRRAEHRPPGP
ncbi:calcium/sodium antiporter [Cellulomonas phragmiteti]|uniref:Sodium:calcium antiporter n=1 Tax=Cellulomonas phragmiteti TaxID=478780 RepID=A0ABQ4DIW1_9CELL|nr:calcium/sodium antiporter [Cellulomonas phragmiteti]GIG39295.1 sodium:calcium antiporter [Cellulomonas phragmiteti]